MFKVSQINPHKNIERHPALISIEKPGPGFRSLLIVLAAFAMSMLAACGGGGGGGGAGGGGGTPLEVSDISLTTDEDTALEITFEASGTNAATAMFVVATQPTNGQISCSGTNNSTCTYTPRLNFFGSDSFTYQADDGTNSTTAATVSITVSPLNDPPAGVPQTITTNEDNAVGFFLAAADVDGDSLTYTITSTPTHGILGCDAINTEQCTYTPSPDYNGSDSFTYTATDSSGETNATSAEVTVNLTVASVNDAPLASSQNASGNEDQALNITLSASDSDGTIATYTVVTQPNSGTLSCTGASCTYTGKTNFSGADTFTFKATDDSGADSNVAVVSISLTQANDAPVAHDMNLTLNEDSTVSFSLSGSDIEGDTLTAFTTTYAGAGSLSCSGALCTYTPAADASGADSFTFTVSDGTATSAPATVTLTIQAVNDAPVASGQNVAADEENTVSLTLSASDSDGTISTYTVVAQPNNGTLSCTGASCTYTGNTNFVGTDTFSFKATDNGGADSNVATVTVNVSQINDAPVAHDQTLGTNDGNPVSFTLYGSDVDGDTIVSYTVDTSSTTGSVSCTGASCTYTPGGSGADSFTFTVSDGTATSAPATVSINVASVGTGPTASNQNVSTGEDTPGSFTLSATDPDSGSLTYTVLANPSNGSVSCDPATGDCTYTPAANYNGADAFTWKANDGSQDSNVGTVSLTVSAANDAPVAHPASYTINQNGSVSFALTGSDIDGDTLTAFNTSYSGSGTLNCTGANCTYTPGGSGPDSFTFTVSDGTATSASATVNLTVVTANLAPSANSQTVAANEEAGTAITLTASDSDGSIATYTVVTQPYSGVLDCSGASCTYTGNTNFVGSDRFTFKATDNSGADSNLATVTVNVSNVNDDPVAIGANYSLNEDNTITFTLTGYDVDGDTLTAFTPNYVGAGSLDCTGADCTYTMGGDNNGVESFTFTVSDGSATSAPATVNMTVVAVNDMPMAYDNVVSLDEDTTINFSVFGYDRESTLTFILPGTTHSGGTLACTGQSCDYTPPADFYGSDYFTFYVNDGSVDSPQATVVINVSPINDDPSAVDVAATTMEDNSTTLSLYGSDPEGAAITINAPSAGDNGGTLVCNGGDCTYTPALNFFGTETFTYTVSDGVATSAPGFVTLTVTPVNDTPTVTVYADYSLVNAGEGVQLYAVATDVEGDEIFYKWRNYLGHQVGFDNPYSSSPRYMMPPGGGPATVEVQVRDWGNLTFETVYVNSLAYTGGSPTVPSNPFLYGKASSSATYQPAKTAITGNWLVGNNSESTSTRWRANITNPASFSMSGYSGLVSGMVDVAAGNWAGADYGIYFTSSYAYIYELTTTTLNSHLHGFSWLYEAIANGNYVYTASNDKVGIINMTDPANPVFTSYIPVPALTGIKSVSVHPGTNRLVVNHLTGIHVASIASPGSPTPIGDAALTGVEQVRFSDSGDFVYGIINGTTFTLNTFDISDPTPANWPAPTSISFNKTGCASDIERSGSYLYCVGTGVVQVFDLTDEANPVLFDVITLPDSAISGISVSGNLLFLSASNNDRRIMVMDYTNKSGLAKLPRGTATLPGVRKTTDMAISSDHLITATGEYATDMDVVDLSDPAAPSHLAAFNSSDTDYTQGVATTGRYVYLLSTHGTNAGALYRMDLLDPANPVQLAINTADIGNDTSLSYPRHLRVENGYAYVSGATGLQIFDVDYAVNPSDTPVLKGEESTGTAVPSHLALNLPYVYISHYATPSIGGLTVDVTSMTAPGLTGTEWMTSSYGRLEMQNDYLYSLEGYNLRVYDTTTDPTTPVELVVYPTYVTREMMISGELAVLAGHPSSNTPNRVLLLDISDPTSIYRRGFFATPDGNGVNSVAVHNDSVIITQNGDQVWTLPLRAHLDNNYTTKSTAGPLTYTVSWTDPAGGERPANVKCYVSDDVNSSCTVSNINNTTNTADISWSFISTGHYEMAVVVGDDMLWVSDKDRVIVTVP